MPCATTGPPLLVGVEKLQNTTEGENKNNRQNRPEHPCRLASRKRASKGASSLKPPKYQSTERIRKIKKRQNARGPERHPDKTAERKDARSERAINKRGGDKNKEKETDQKSA